MSTTLRQWPVLWWWRWRRRRGAGDTNTESAAEQELERRHAQTAPPAQAPPAQRNKPPPRFCEPRQHQELGFENDKQALRDHEACHVGPDQKDDSGEEMAVAGHQHGDQLEGLDESQAEPSARQAPCKDQRAQ